MASGVAPVVSVLAANSQQSSSIVAHLLSLGEIFSKRFRLRSIVRNPSSYTPPQISPNDGRRSAQVGQVDEVVQGDMNSVESLKQAFKGTSVVWAMTNSVPDQGPEAELQIGKNIVDAFLAVTADAAQGDTVSGDKPLLILSSCPDVEALTQGKIKMINATGKSWIEKYVHELPVEVQNRFRFTVVHPAMFMQNFITYQKPVVNNKGIHHFRAAVRPDAQLPFVDISDLGPLVWQLLDSAFPANGPSDMYAQYDRATIRLIGEYLSYPQIVAQFTQASGKAAAYDHLDLNQFLSESFGMSVSDVQSQFKARDAGTGGETIATMIGDMYNLINWYGYYAGIYNTVEGDPRTEKILFHQPSRQTPWAQFVKKHFGATTEDDSSATISKLKLPAGLKPDSELSPVERFLKSLAAYFVDKSPETPFTSGEHPNDMLDLIVNPWYAPDATVEFPFFPKPLREQRNLRPSTNPNEDGVLLRGHDELAAYFGKWKDWIWFSGGEIKSLAKLTTTTSASTAVPTVEGAVMEMKLYGKVKVGEEKAYVQDYVCFAYMNDDGKVAVYKEYWSPTRI